MMTSIRMPEVEWSLSRSFSFGIFSINTISSDEWTVAKVSSRISNAFLDRIIPVLKTEPRLFSGFSYDFTVTEIVLVNGVRNLLAFSCRQLEPVGHISLFGGSSSVDLTLSSA